MGTSNKPIFVATHPRACSTAFERVFMTRRDILHCIHEPFGDAFYFGPERLSRRYENDEEARKKSGFADVTYKDVMDRVLDPAASEGKRVFIKDIAHYLLPPDNQPAGVAPSFLAGADGNKDSNGNTPNPTVVPLALLRKFHFAFLIRHPRRAIPSYYRCTIPPLSSKTGFHSFMPSEAGYDELRRLFDYLRAEGVVGGEDGGAVPVTVVDADDLLDKPAEVIRAFCEAVGVDYTDRMLRWDDEEGQRMAVEAFEKWNGFHDDAIGSTGLKARTHGARVLSVEEEDEEWRQKYGEEGQRVIRECVNANIPTYEYLKSFALKV